MDVFAKGQNRFFNVEMQAVKHKALGRRSRYYHSHIDMDSLLSGGAYDELSDTYVIFICDFDPFGKEKYRYTFESVCIEDDSADLEEGRKTIFLSTHGKNKDEVPKALVRFLDFVHADLEHCMNDFGDDFVRRIQKTMMEIRNNRQMEERYMLLNLMLQDERKAGREEGMAEGLEKGTLEGKKESLIMLLENFGTIPDELRERFSEESNLEVLNAWFKLAMQACSIEDFAKSL